MQIILVALGGMCGAVSRYLLGKLVQKLAGGVPSLPYGTLLANISGCLLAGVVIGIISTKALPAAENIRLLLVIGFTGGLTTFSSFSLDTISLLQGQHYVFAVANIFANLAAGLIATVLGIGLVKVL
jgi:CrcB protein